MSPTLPFAVRVAAGLVSEALGRARRLPADITTLPVAVLGQVAKLSFEVNHQLAELAGEGDRLLAGLHGTEEPPQRTAWATIDDEDEVAAKDPQAAATWPVPAAGSAGHTDTDTADLPDAAADPVAAAGGQAATRARAATTPVPAEDPQPPAASPRLVIDEQSPGSRSAGAPRPARSPRPARRRTPTSGSNAQAGSAGSTGSIKPTGSTEPAGSTEATAPMDAAGTGMDRALIEDIDALEVDRPAPLVGLPTPAEDVTADDPVDVSSMSIGQLRGRVRSWPVEQVRAALEQEQRGKARPAFLTVLTNRLSTLARGGA